MTTMLAAAVLVVALLEGLVLALVVQAVQELRR